MNRILTFALGISSLMAFAGLPVELVEPRIGTSNSTALTAGMFGKGSEELGQTLPAVLEPHGMNTWTPQTRATEQKCVAPYYYGDSLLQGFRNSHWIVGGCTQDYGSVTVACVTATRRLTARDRGTRMDKATEVSKPDYYSVVLPEEHMKSELTGSSRSAFIRYTYFEKGKAWLIVTPNSDEAQGSVRIDIGSRMITGSNPVHRIYQGWGEEAGFAGHFAVEWPESLKITSYGTFSADSIFEGSESLSGLPEMGAYVGFDTDRDESITFRVSSSFTGVEGAVNNMKAELDGLDFDRARERLAAIWNEHLDRVHIEGGTQEKLEQFYSALYRCSVLPRAINDTDGSYPQFAAGGRIMNSGNRDYYNDFSMWDTYRALHPLLVILSPKRSSDMMQSLTDMYSQGGWMPIFPCWNSYTSAMIGDHCAAAIADAYVKGVGGFDVGTAYEGLLKNAYESPENIEDYRNGMGRRALKSYLQYGYIPLEDSVPDAFHQREQTSRTLEYAYDDYALSRLSLALGDSVNATALERRSNNYRNVIDPITGYANGRYADGRFDPTSDPFDFSKAITEGAPCHYTWYVPHDQQGLMEIIGGREAYVAKLDSMFSMGRYWHGNEPCHQIAWLYNYADEPWKTQKQVRHILSTEYGNGPGGLSGNDDAGQMSAWYVFASLGFYPVCPGIPEYALGSPVFPYVEIDLENGKTFKIIARDTSEENIYVSSVKLNGIELNRPFITHDDIINGGVLEFSMSANPSYTCFKNKPIQKK